VGKAGRQAGSRGVSVSHCTAHSKQGKWLQ